MAEPKRCARPWIERARYLTVPWAAHLPAPAGVVQFTCAVHVRTAPSGEAGKVSGQGNGQAGKTSTLVRCVLRRPAAVRTGPDRV
jgi:hypothetical protein